MSPNIEPISDRDFGIKNKFLCPLLILLAGTGMTLMSWRKWGDPIVDFGLQIYYSWRISEGLVLYKDLDHYHGPLSLYLNALLFKIFGPGILILDILNLFLIAVLTWLFFRLFKKIGNELSATVVSLTFITVFAFAQYISVGNYNFVRPYVYEITHGIVLIFAVVYQLMKFLEDGIEKRVPLTGFLVGLVLLTKTEVFVAGFSALFLGWVFAFQRKGLSFKEQARGLSTFMIATTIPYLLFAAYFCFHLPFKEAVAAPLTHWNYLFHSSAVRSLEHYQAVMGTNAIGANTETLLVSGFYYLLGLGFLLAVNHGCVRLFQNQRVPAALLTLSLAVPILFFYKEIPWPQLLRPLPLFMAGLTCFFLVAAIRKSRTKEIGEKTVLLLVLSVFSLGMVSKMILNSHVFHYGFALVLPGTLLLTHLMVYSLPRLAKQVSGKCEVFQAASLLLVTLFIAFHVYFSSGFYKAKNFPLGAGPDTMIDYDPKIKRRSILFHFALESINNKLDPDSSFATFPTGSLLNYMTRRKNAIRYVSYGPVDWKIFGEEPVLNALKESLPAYIVLVGRSHREDDKTFFGIDYGQTIYSWILENYQSIETIGPPPLEGKGFGIEILQFNRGERAILESANKPS